MSPVITTGVLFLALITLVTADNISSRTDPCTVIAGQKWVSPEAVRACFTSFALNSTIKENILDVVEKTLAFHTSVNYERLAPPPFSSDVHEDILGDIARIRNQTYATEFDMHVDLSRSVKRLDDGHCVYINMCYDSLFLTFIPTPLVLLTNPDGSQNVHIAPEAFVVASAEFADEIQVWQNALPDTLKGNLSELSGAKVLAINGADPFVAVDANALITGSFQGFGTRQIAFFSSYQVATTGWNYIMGNFAQMSLPLADSATLTIQRVNSSKAETITLPYRSRIGTTAIPWTDSASFRENNCVAIDGTNGIDLAETNLRKRADVTPAPVAVFQQNSVDISPSEARKNPLNVMLDVTPPQDIALPPGLTPVAPISGSSGVAQFFMLADGKTGVLALGSFDADSLDGLLQSMLTGLQNLKDEGATQLIVDVSNNGGGFICAAHFLHRIIVGPKSTTVPQAGLDTKTRAGPLAMQVVKQILNSGLDPDVDLAFNPLNWAFANNTPFPADFDWLDPPVKTVINGKADAFSIRMRDICQPFDIDPPAESLFDPAKIVIVGNGRCASSCSLFSVTMAKEEGVKTVVLGGKKDVQQEYCGTVGGQSTDFSTIDTEIKTTHLKNSSLAPPDFLTNSVQGITFRLGFGVDDPTQPEEWQNHPADVNLPLTPALVNNPHAIWNIIAQTIL